MKIARPIVFSLVYVPTYYIQILQVFSKINNRIFNFNPDGVRWNKKDSFGILPIPTSPTGRETTV